LNFLFRAKIAKNRPKIGIISAIKTGVKSEVEETRKPAMDFASRTARLDAKITSLDDRIARNKAELERTNAQLTLKIAEMLKRLASGR
jgi:uncharacterized small protein (DUF1192 family)